MKRALILALLLAGALALLLLLIRRESEPDALVNAPQAQPVDVAEHANELSRAPELELPANAQHKSREVLPTDPESSAEARSSSSSTEATSVVRVDVRYEDSDTPVPGAVVELGPSVLATAGTNARGRAELRVPVGRMPTLVRVHPGDGSPFVPYEHNLDPPLQAGGPAIQVRVCRGTDLCGIVLDAQSNRPVSGARVRCSSFGYRTDVTTGEDGRFRIVALLAGPRNLPQALSFEHAEHLPAHYQPEAADLVPDAEPLRILMQRGLRITGRLVDSDRLPVARAQISLIATRSYQTITDERGQFAFDGLGAVDRAQLVVGTQALDKCAVIGTELDLGSVSETRADIEMQVQSALQLLVSPEWPDGTDLMFSRFEVVGGSAGLHPRGMSAASDYRVRINRLRSAGDSTNTVPGDVAFSTDLEVQARIVPRGPDVDIEVIARAFGADLSNALWRGVAHVQTGRAVASPHEVHVRLTELYAPVIPPLPAGANEITLERTERAGAIDVQVIDASSGRPLGEGQVSTKYRDVSQVVSIQGEGWLRLRAPPGDYAVEVQLEGGPSKSFHLTIPLSGHARTTWHLRRAP